MREKIRLKVNHETLTGILSYPKGSKRAPMIIFFNGSGGVKERFLTIADFLLERGYASFCFDFRGRGESLTKKTPPLSFQLQDAEEVIKYIASLPFIDKTNIVLVATSMGAYVASCVSNVNSGIKQIILFAPAMYVPKDEKKPYTTVKVANFKKELIDKARSIREIKKFRGELFVVFLGRDKTIPFWMVQAYLNNATQAKKKIKMEIKNSEHPIFRTASGQKKAQNLLAKILNI